MKRLLLILAVVAASASATCAQQMFYVIKVTPTLLYLDAGLAAGVQPKDHYLILTKDAPDGTYTPVAEVAVVRVAEGYSIAEILSRVEGRPLEVLQRAISARDWELMAPPVEETKPVTGPEETLAPEPEATGAPEPRTWSLSLVGGGEWNKGFALRGARVERITDVGAGLRLSRTWSDRYRLNLGARLAGGTVGATDADVSQLGVEADLHYLFRGAGRAGPYLGAGAGMHRLSWQSPAGDESTYKVGFTGTGGLLFPLDRDGWTLLFESGYQRVLKWDELIDASNARTYLGLGRNW